MQTGLASPQFHCVFDANFETVVTEHNDLTIWQQKAHMHICNEDLPESTICDHLVSSLVHQKASLPQYAIDVTVALYRISSKLKG